MSTNMMILNGSTIINFVEDKEAFNGWVKDRFDQLDLNRDGLLSYKEMVKEFECLRLETEHEDLENIYNEVFLKFDQNADGSMDSEEYTAGMRRIVVAVANAIGPTPVQMVLEHDGFLKKAVEKESS